MSGTNGHLSAAEGWLILGAPAEAWEELENLPPEKRATGEALTLRVLIFLALGRYGDAMMIVLPLVKAAPERADLHFLAARALAKLGKLEKAEEITRRLIQGSESGKCGRPIAAVSLRNHLLLKIAGNSLIPPSVLLGMKPRFALYGSLLLIGLCLLLGGCVPFPMAFSHPPPISEWYKGIDQEVEKERDGGWCRARTWAEYWCTLGVGSPELTPSQFSKVRRYAIEKRRAAGLRDLPCLVPR